MTEHRLENDDLRTAACYLVGLRVLGHEETCDHLDKLLAELQSRRSSPSPEGVRGDVIEECAKKIDAKADLYKAYSEQAKRNGYFEKAARMWGHYQTTWEDARDIRSLANAPVGSAPPENAGGSMNHNSSSPTPVQEG